MRIHIDDLKDLRVGTLLACLVVSVVWHSGERLVNLIPGHQRGKQTSLFSSGPGLYDAGRTSRLERFSGVLRPDVVA